MHIVWPLTYKAILIPCVWLENWNRAHKLQICSIGSELKKMKFKRDDYQLIKFIPTPENTPMGNKLKWLPKEGGGCIFESCDISLENMPTSHQLV